MKHKNGNRLERFFLIVFLILSLLVSLTLFFYYKMNVRMEQEFSYIRDVHHLKAHLVKFSDSKVKGYVEIQEVFTGLNILGKIEGLAPGSEHSVHILEFADIADLDESKLSKESLRHYNPTNSPHHCPNSYSKVEDYHFGDLGNFIANNEGIGYLSLIKNISIKNLNGRALVITKTRDKCESHQEFDEPNDIIAYGLLNVYKQDLPNDTDFSQDYFIKKINSSNSKQEVNNHITTDNQITSEVKVEKELTNILPLSRNHIATSTGPNKLQDKSAEELQHNNNLKNSDKVSRKPEESPTSKNIPFNRRLHKKEPISSVTKNDQKGLIVNKNNKSKEIISHNQKAHDNKKKIKTEKNNLHLPEEIIDKDEPEDDYDNSSELDQVTLGEDSEDESSDVFKIKNSRTRTGDFFSLFNNLKGHNVDNEVKFSPIEVDANERDDPPRYTMPNKLTPNSRRNLMPNFFQLPFNVNG